MSDTLDLDKAREDAGKLHDEFYCDICHGAKNPSGCAEREATAVAFLQQRAEEAERCSELHLEAKPWKRITERVADLKKAGQEAESERNDYIFTK